MLSEAYIRQPGFRHFAVLEFKPDSHSKFRLTLSPNPESRAHNSFRRHFSALEFKPDSHSKFRLERMDPPCEREARETRTRSKSHARCTNYLLSIAAHRQKLTTQTVSAHRRTTAVHKNCSMASGTSQRRGPGMRGRRCCTSRIIFSIRAYAYHTDKCMVNRSHYMPLSCF